jgi:diacylglycerol kinase (ATP)
MSSLAEASPREVRTLLLHNPNAGARHPDAETLMKSARAAGFSPTYQSVKSKDYKAALSRDWDLVIVAGGDGTVARAARGLKDRSIPVAILPVGTANNIARSLGIVGEPDALLPRLLTAQILRLDLGLATGPWGKTNFLEAVGLGPIAEVILQSNTKPPKPIRIEVGREALQRCIRESEAEKFAIDVDGENFAGEFLLIEILNLSFTGPALPIASSAVSDDQLLDVVFLFASDRTAMEEWLAGAPEEVSPPLTLRRGRKVSLDWESWPLRIDSTVYFPPPKPTRIKIEIEKQGLRVLVPG